MKKLLNQPQRILALCLLIFVTSTQLFAQCGVGNLYSSRTLPANSGVMVSGACDYAGEYTPWTEAAASPQTYNVVICNSATTTTANPDFTNSPWVEVRDNADNLLNSGYADCTSAGLNFTSNGAGPYKISTWDGNTCGTTATCSYNQVECLTCPATVCNIGSTLNGAGTVSGTTVGAGNNSLLRASEDYIVQVTIPSAGNWTFSLCGSAFDTYLYLGNACGTGDIASNDDNGPACTGSASSLVSNLAAGTYFVTIEAYSATSAGAFLLVVEQGDTTPCTANVSDIPDQEICEGDGGGIDANLSFPLEPYSVIYGSAPTPAANYTLAYVLSTNSDVIIDSQVMAGAFNTASNTPNFTYSGLVGATYRMYEIIYRTSDGPLTGLTAGGNISSINLTTGNCLDATYANIYVNPYCNTCPIAVASNNGPVCEGSSINLVVNANLYASVTATYAWSGNGITSTQQNPVIANATSAKAGTYTVTVTYSNGCTATASTTVVVIAKPTVTAVASCVAGVGSITVTATGTGLTYNIGAGSQASNVFNNVADGTYAVTVTNAAGCTKKATNIVVSCDICSNAAAPTNLNTTNITATSATVNWDAVAGATSYTIKGRRVDSGNPWKTIGPVLGTSKTVSSETAACKIYEWKVQANCPSGQSSPFSIISTFSTIGCTNKTSENSNEDDLFSSAISQTFSLSPNPANNLVTLYYSTETETPLNISIIDVTGRVVSQQNTFATQGDNTINLDTNQLPQGYYVVELNDGTTKMHEKLLIAR